jgi:hypothetical protein
MRPCDDRDAYHPIAFCDNSSCLLCINVIVGSARLLRHDTPGHESDRREDAQEARRKLDKCTMSKCSMTCYVLMLLDDLSKRSMYECAQAARRKLGKCTTPLGCDVLLCSRMRIGFMLQAVHVDRPRCELRTCS